MLEQPPYSVDDPAEIVDLIRANPWATLISATGDSGLVVSHLPVIVEDNSSDPDASDLAGMRDDAADAVVVLGHLAKTDAALHQLGQHPVVLIVQGPHGYLSPSWYLNGPHVPTWDFVVAHLHGRPAVLTTGETFDVLAATVDHLEAGQSRPWRLDAVPGYASRLAPATIGFRLRPDRVVGKAKLHQDEHPAEALHLAGRRSCQQRRRAGVTASAGRRDLLMLAGVLPVRVPWRPR